MPALLLVLILCALITTIVSALGKCPVWIPMFVIVVTLMVAFWPK